MKNVAEQSEKIMAEIHRRALLFCVDNARYGNEGPAIEAAMAIGASIVTEVMHDEMEKASEIIEQLYEPLPGVIKPTGRFLTPLTEEQEASSRPLGES